MEELQREVAQLKIEVKNLRSIVDELGFMVVNHPSFLAQEDTETLIRKSQNTLHLNSSKKKKKINTNHNAQCNIRQAPNHFRKHTVP